MLKKVKRKIKSIVLKRLHLVPFPKFVEPCYFLNNSKDNKTLIIILIGYKSYLWDSFFERFDLFAPKNVDVCLLSTSPFNEALLKIATKRNFSYFVISSNSVTLAINSCVQKYSNATDIFKIDEDIFLTHGVFENLLKCYKKAIKYTDIAFVAPLINLNCISAPIILNELRLFNDFERRFGQFRYCLNNLLETNVGCAQYMWGYSKVPKLDALNKIFMNKPEKFIYATHRFSIGMIYFKRTIIEEIGYFNTALNDMGNDEYQLCAMSMNFFKACVICCNAVVGHFSFGNQTQQMKLFFEKHSNLFDLSDVKKHTK